MPGPLWEQTRDLHHACEAHPVGAAMASGTPPMQWYADWLGVLLTLHTAVDPHMSQQLRRVELLQQDIESCSASPWRLLSPDQYVQTLTNEQSIAGAAYVLTGAHLMGGEIMRRRLVGYPTAHLTWQDRPACIRELQIYRTRTDLTNGARACFAALLAAMDEILELDAIR